MSRNRLIVASFVLSAMVTCAPRLCQAQPKPNILVIMADDVGWMNVASYGGDVMGARVPSAAIRGQPGKAASARRAWSAGLARSVVA